MSLYQSRVRPELGRGYRTPSPIALANLELGSLKSSKHKRPI